jgi:hypothetical protein
MKVTLVQSGVTQTHFHAAFRPATPMKVTLVQSGVTFRAFTWRLSHFPRR